MSAPTMEKDRTADSGAEDYSSSVEEAQPVTRSSKKSRKGSKQGKKSKKDSMALDQVPTGGVENMAGNLGSSVTNTMGSVANTALENQGKEKDDGGKSDTLRLRLDLNLDIEIQLKARIHGDLELALLN